MVFVLQLFVPHHSSLGASGMLCFVTIAFPGYLMFMYRVDFRYLTPKDHNLLKCTEHIKQN